MLRCSDTADSDVFGSKGVIAETKPQSMLTSKHARSCNADADVDSKLDAPVATTASEQLVQHYTSQPPTSPPIRSAAATHNLPRYWDMLQDRITDEQAKSFRSFSDVPRQVYGCVLSEEQMLELCGRCAVESLDTRQS
jgi:hypothetical protein